MSKKQPTTRKKLTREETDEVFNYINERQNEKIFNIDTVRIDIKCKTEGQKRIINSIRDNQITIVKGFAGTGKTFLACAQALNLLKIDKKFKKIILIKSVTTLKEEEIGFLKGNMEEKMEPFVYSFMNNFEKLVGPYITGQLKLNNYIEILPVAYLRGINIDSSIVIVDEIQNLTKDHLITILTRLGFDSKMILLGDSDQVDRKNKKDSGISWLVDTFQDMEDIGVVEMSSDDIVRNPLVKKILDRLNEINN